METQQPSLDLSTLSHALPTPPSTAEPEKVTASLSTLPPELKLKIVEEVYENSLDDEELYVLRQLPMDNRGRSSRLTNAGRPTDLARLSRISRDWHEMCMPRLWETLHLAYHSCQGLLFLFDKVLPRYACYVRFLDLGSPTQDRTESFGRFDGLDGRDLAQHIEALSRRILELDTAPTEVDRPPGVNVLIEILLSRILDACSGVQHLEMTVTKEGPLERVCQATEQHAAKRSLTALHLTVETLPSQPKSPLYALLARSPSLLHLTLEFEWQRSPFSSAYLAESANSFSQLKSLKLVLPPQSFLADLRLPSAIEALHLSAEEGTEYPNQVLADFLQSFRDTLGTLVLENIQPVTEPGHSTRLDLPKLNRLTITAFTYFRSYPLSLFQDSPIRHLQFDGPHSDFFSLLVFLKQRVSTLRTFSYGEKYLYVDEDESCEDFEAEVEAIEEWCGAYGVECSLPRVVEQSTFSDQDYNYSDDYDYGSGGDDVEYDPENDLDLDWRLAFDD
ncbi:hypothetical protein JCM6882_008038 [Rhodosporidiobolus microsporus]